MSGFSSGASIVANSGFIHRTRAGSFLPPRREGKVVIPGRSGYYDGVAGMSTTSGPRLFIVRSNARAGKTVPEVCREIAYWLSGTGRLVYDKEPDKYYTARISGGPPMAQHLKYGEFDLTWNYNPPFALGRTVTQPIASGENLVDYQGTAETPCIIVLRNLSDADVLTVTITAIKRSV